jgi:hypothetical protein
MIRTITSAFLALSFIAGSAGLAAAYENDNDRSTYSAKQFYEKEDQARP